MTNFIKLLFLGLIQGASEFLPISSSGHLTIFQKMFKLHLPDEVFFDVLLHVATLISVFIVYKKDIYDLIKEAKNYLKDIVKGRLSAKNPKRRLLLMLFVSVLPLFTLVPLKSKIERTFNSLWIVGVCLIITSFLLFLIDKIINSKKTEKDASFGSAFIVGLSQAIAIFPGLSRSGTTIAAGTLCGFEKKFAVKFSFLMSIIAVLGALVLKIKDAFLTFSILSRIDIAGYCFSFIAALVSGVFAIRLLDRLIENKKFHYFSYYCLIMGIMVLINV